MDVAFSRDRAEKTYVQHRMKERGRDVFAWLEDGAHVYVCGDAAHLAPDVHRALIEIVAQEAHTGFDAAEDYVRTLQADHRYQRDVY
jgi:sulfite reductase (NADPH) flavoprotein alpha-component